jgi:hypothetical protein
MIENSTRFAEEFRIAFETSIFTTRPFSQASLALARRVDPSIVNSSEAWPGCRSKRVFPDLWTEGLGTRGMVFDARPSQVSDGTLALPEVEGAVKLEDGVTEPRLIEILDSELQRTRSPVPSTIKDRKLLRSLWEKQAFNRGIRARRNRELNLENCDMGIS